MELKNTLSEIQNQFKSALSGHYPDDEIRQIFYLVTEYLLSYSKIDTFLKAGDAISAETVEKFHFILERLEAWEPVQYIIGSTYFYGLTLAVDRRVLIPRQETEELVDWVLKSEGNKPYNLIDIGCGSGCIGIALAVNASEIHITACDISEEALQVASENAVKNNANIDFFRFDVLGDALLPEKYQVMVSNPPYVQVQEKVLMKKNVLDYEPPIAVFAPEEDSLLYYKRIALLARKHLTDGGCLYFEINEHLAKEMIKLLKTTGFCGVELKHDLNGKPRMIRGRK
jgi:release factor glutamine methyltransferase